MKGKIKVLVVAAVLVIGVTNCQSSDFQPSQTNPGVSETISPLMNPSINNPFNPLLSDDGLIRGQAYTDSVELDILQDAAQAQLVFKGSLPTPCSQLRLSVLFPTDSNRIDVNAYSLSSPDEVCAQVLQEFEAAIQLNGLDRGDYIVFVNDHEMLRFAISSEAAPLPAGATFTNIVQDILSLPENFTGQQVVVVGYYRGWDLLGEASGQSPVTRSDWVIKDDSGAIYVSAQGNWSGDTSLVPGSLEETTKVLRLTGIVRQTSAGQPYIEPMNVELID